MAFTYSLATDRGAVRLTIADTNSASYAFEDDEIDYFLTQGTTVTGASILAMRALLADRARRVKIFTVQGQSYNDNAQIAGIEKWLTIHGGNMPTCGTVMPAGQAYDSGYVEVPITS